MLTSAQQEQFTRLWTETQPTVSHYLSSLLADSSVVKDVLQNTALVLLKKFSEYDTSLPFLSWALGIAKFEILSHRRDSARSRLVYDSEFLDRYTEAWANSASRLSDEASALRHCVTKLSQRQQQIIRLRYTDELSSAEIGPHLNLTAANIRRILKRTREALQRCVEARLRLEGGS